MAWKAPAGGYARGAGALAAHIDVAKSIEGEEAAAIAAGAAVVGSPLACASIIELGEECIARARQRWLVRATRGHAGATGGAGHVNIPHCTVYRECATMVSPPLPP